MSYAAARELAYRNQKGLEVTLLWGPRSNEVVAAIDQLDASGFSLPVAGRLALDAFNHPYAYVQSHENDRDRTPQMTTSEGASQ